MKEEEEEEEGEEGDDTRIIASFHSSCTGSKEGEGAQSLMWTRRKMQEKEETEEGEEEG